MNKCYFFGRTVRDIDLRYTTGERTTALGKFTLAVDRGYGENKKTDFLPMTAWGKTAETLEHYAPKGTKLIVECQAEQNNYINKDGVRVNTIDFRILNFWFAENKKTIRSNEQNNDGFINIPEGLDEELPFA